MEDIRPIIGILAPKQSGKDTVAKMLVYIFNVGPLRANFREWTIKYDRPTKDKKLKQVIHFGDYPKDILSKTLGIERSLFDDVEYKENKYYLMDTRTFVDKDKLTSNYIVASNNVLDVSPLASLCNTYYDKVAITLRTLMQYFGTGLGRNCLSRDCWVRPTISDAINISNKYGYSIIADVRFNNESNAITNQKDGYVIRLVRETGYVDDHVSEVIDGVEFNLLIENNGSKLELFHRVIAFVTMVNNCNLIKASSSTGESTL